MNTNHWHPSGPIEYEDRLRKLSRPKPAHPIAVFELEQPRWLQKIRHLLLGLLRGIARLAVQIRHRETPMPSTVMRGDSPQA